MGGGATNPEAIALGEGLADVYALMVKARFIAMRDGLPRDGRQMPLVWNDWLYGAEGCSTGVGYRRLDRPSLLNQGQDEWMPGFATGEIEPHRAGGVIGRLLFLLTAGVAPLESGDPLRTSPLVPEGSPGIGFPIAARLMAATMGFPPAGDATTFLDFRAAMVATTLSLNPAFSKYVQEAFAAVNVGDRPDFQPPRIIGDSGGVVYVPGSQLHFGVEDRDPEHGTIPPSYISSVKVYWDNLLMAEQPVVPPDSYGFSFTVTVPDQSSDLEVEHTLHIEATDILGNRAFKRVVVKVDTRAPSFNSLLDTTVAPAEDPFTKRYTLEMHPDMAGFGEFWCTDPDGHTLVARRPLLASQTFTFTYVSLTSELGTLVCHYTDRLGNEREGWTTHYVDQTPPSCAFRPSYGSGGTGFAGTPPRVSVRVAALDPSGGWGAQPPGSVAGRVTIALDVDGVPRTGGPIGLPAPPETTYSRVFSLDVAPGMHTYRARCTDDWGNVSTATRDKETTAGPTASIGGSVSVWNGTNYTVTWSGIASDPRRLTTVRFGRTDGDTGTGDTVTFADPATAPTSDTRTRTFTSAPIGNRIRTS
jgi:hypothetical protein